MHCQVQHLQWPVSCLVRAAQLCTDLRHTCAGLLHLSRLVSALNPQPRSHHAEACTDCPSSKRPGQQAPRRCVLAAPKLRGLQVVPDRLFGGATPGRIGRKAAHCYIAEAAQLRERPSVGSGRWQVAINSATAVVSNGRTVRLRRTPRTAENWTAQAAQRLGCTR